MFWLLVLAAATSTGNCHISSPETMSDDDSLTQEQIFQRVMTEGLSTDASEGQDDEKMRGGEPEIMSDDVSVNSRLRRMTQGYSTDPNDVDDVDDDVNTTDAPQEPVKVEEILSDDVSVNSRLRRMTQGYSTDPNDVEDDVNTTDAPQEPVKVEEILSDDVSVNSILREMTQGHSTDPNEVKDDVNTTDAPQEAVKAEEEAPQVPVKAKRGRPIKFEDEATAKQRERKRANLAQKREERNPVGRPVVRADRGYTFSSRENERRRQLKVEKEIVNNVSDMKLGDKAGQSAYLAALELKRGKEELQEPMTSGMQTEEEIRNVSKYHESSKKSYAQMSLAQKKKHLSFVTEDQPTKYVGDVLGISERTARRFKVHKQSVVDRKDIYRMNETVIEDIEDHYDSITINALEAELYVEFFKSKTGVLSGAVRLTRVLEIPKFNLFALMYGAYPQMLRNLHKDHPNLLEQLSPISRLGKSMTAALENANRPEFDADRENATRVEMATTRYEEKMRRKRLRTNRSIAPARLRKKQPKTAAKVELSLEESAHEKRVQPLGDVKFMRVVKEAGIKYTKKSKPYNCPIHDNGHLWTPKLEANAKSLIEIRAMLEKWKMLAKEGQLNEEEKRTTTALEQREKDLVDVARKINVKVDEYKEHLKQFEVCREAITKKEANLKVGECVVYRDFVNQYTCDGKKMANLQFVIIYRTEPTGNLKQLRERRDSGIVRS